MTPIRRIVWLTPAAVGGVAAILAIGAQAGLAEPPAGNPGQHVSALLQTTPTSACTTAQDALKAAQAADKTEDANERPLPKTSPDASTDKTEDTAENAKMKSLADAVRTACEPPPSAQCASARQALANAESADKTEDAAERAAAKTTAAADSAEDKTEAAGLKPVRDAVAAACEPQKPTPSAACVTARDALEKAESAGKAEDQAEKSSKLTPSADTTEDKAEKAQTDALHQAERAACAPSERTKPAH
jgi:hypothetical protein